MPLGVVSPNEAKGARMGFPERSQFGPKANGYNGFLFVPTVSVGMPPWTVHSHGDRGNQWFRFPERSQTGPGVVSPNEANSATSPRATPVVVRTSKKPNEANPPTRSRRAVSADEPMGGTHSMIEPVRSGKALLDEIHGTFPVAGSVAIWWLGQSGFLLKSESVSLLIDPYLSEHLTAKYHGTPREHVRMTRAPIRGHELRPVDIVVTSHKHSDHFDPGTLPGLLAASPAAPLVVPRSLLGHAESLALDPSRLVGLSAHETWQRPGIQVRAIPSAHEALESDEHGDPLYLGFVIDLDGLRFYHSGDTLAYDGLAEAIGSGVDVMFLPINGRDPARGVPGNMTAAEAVDLANRVRPRFVVPHHYEMFTFNTVPVSVFEDEALRLVSKVSSRLLRCGERWEVSR